MLNEIDVENFSILGTIANLNCKKNNTIEIKTQKLSSSPSCMDTYITSRDNGNSIKNSVILKKKIITPNSFSKGKIKVNNAFRINDLLKYSNSNNYSYQENKMTTYIKPILRLKDNKKRVICLNHNKNKNFLRYKLTDDVNKTFRYTKYGNYNNLLRTISTTDKSKKRNESNGYFKLHKKFKICTSQNSIIVKDPKKDIVIKPEKFKKLLISKKSCPGTLKILTFNKTSENNYTRQIKNKKKVIRNNIKKRQENIKNTFKTNETKNKKPKKTKVKENGKKKYIQKGKEIKSVDNNKKIWTNRQKILQFTEIQIKNIENGKNFLTHQILNSYSVQSSKDSEMIKTQASTTLPDKIKKYFKVE